MNFDKPEHAAELADGASFEANSTRERKIPEELIRTGAEYVKKGKVNHKSIDSGSAGITEITGTVQCRFGLVRRPTLTVARRREKLLVVRHHCGCREGAQNHFCVHCAALLSAQFPNPEAMLREETQNPTEADGKGIRIRLGTQRKNAEPIFWAPEDPERVSTPNMAVIGGADTGNTQVMKSVALQFLRQREGRPGETGLLILDWMGDYSETKTGFLETTGAKVRKLQKLPLDPFSLQGLERKPQLHVHRAMAFADTLARAYELGPLQKSTLVQSVMAAYASKGITSDPLTWDRKAPTFAEVYEEYCARPQTQRSDALSPVMDSLAAFELFDPQPPERRTAMELFQGVVVVDMSGYPSQLQSFAAGMMLEQFYALLCGSRCRPTGHMRRMLMIDEADALLEMGSPGLEGILSRSREHGMSVVMAVQSPRHFCSGDFDWWKVIRTWVIHNAEDLYRPELEALLQLDAFEAGADRLYQSVKRQQKFQSLIRIGTEEPLSAEDLPFYEILTDSRQSYQKEQRQEAKPLPLEGMPQLDMRNLDGLKLPADPPAAPMAELNIAE